MSKKVFYYVVSLVLLLLQNSVVNAQIVVTKHFDAKSDISGYSNVGSFMAYDDGLRVRNYKNILLFISSEYIKDVVINPTLSSLAVVYNGKRYIDIVSCKNQNTVMCSVRDKRKGAKSAFLAACYTFDAKEFIATNSNGEILEFSTSEYSYKDCINAGKQYSFITTSPNQYYIVASDGNSVDVWNKDTKELRKSFELGKKVRCVSFSEDSRNMAVATEAGLVFIDVVKMEPVTVIAEDSDISSCAFHPDGKYLVFSSYGELFVFNYKNMSIAASVNQDSEGLSLNSIKHVGLVKNVDGTCNLVNNTRKRIYCWNLSQLSPFYGALFSDALSDGLDEWMKQADDESLEDFRIRVNDENAAIQRAKLLEELATKKGIETVKFTDPFVSENYDFENHAIAVSFEGAMPVMLDLPESELASLKEGKFTFSEPLFTINDQDELEFTYLVAVNEVTGAKYIYDNRQYIRLADLFGADDMDYIPVAIRQQALEDIGKLEEQKVEIVEENRTRQLITGKTEVSVSSEVKADFDADGNKIYNYQVQYKYDVSEGFSAYEDFAPGKFEVSNSNAALTMLQTLDKAMSTELTGYLERCSSVEVLITGTADSKPVHNIAYNDIYGTFKDEPYYSKGMLSSITLSKQTGITSNEQLAFIRAVSAKDWMVSNIEGVKDNIDKFKFSYNADVAVGEGGEYRRIVVDVKFKNAY